MRRFLLAAAVLVLALIPSISSGAADSQTCLGHEATIVGTDDEGDTLVGTKGPDVIVGLGGSDLINGRGGRDIICGGPGHDSNRNHAGLYGGPGADIISGGEHEDDLNGGRPYDQGKPEGINGDDVLLGDSGADHLCDDSCYIDPDEPGPPRYIGVGDDFLSGGADADVCYISKRDVSVSC